MAFSNVAKSLAVQLSAPHATDITDSSEHLDYILLLYHQPTAQSTN